jgi:uncharacterized protein (UPF0333 family)
MRRLLFTIVLIIIALNVGAYVGKEKMNKFYLAAGEKTIKATKNTVVWTSNKWNEQEIPEK